MKRIATLVGDGHNPVGVGNGIHWGRVPRVGPRASGQPRALGRNPFGIHREVVQTQSDGFTMRGDETFGIQPELVHPQRGCVPKPRVARHELPWETVPLENVPNPNGVAPF
jgi:hypothetical protein